VSTPPPSRRIRNRPTWVTDLGEAPCSELSPATCPVATIVKRFNAMFATLPTGGRPRHLDGRQVCFYAGDDSI